MDHDPKYRCTGRCQANHSKTRLRLDTHVIRGQTYDKCLSNSLWHYKQCLGMPVVVTYKTKQDGGYNRLRCKAI